MKKIFILGLLLISIISCKNENEMLVNTTIKGLKKGTVYLQKIQDSTLITLDSIIVNGSDEAFTLKTITDSPEIFYLYIDKIDGIQYNDRISFFGEKGELNITTHLNKINSNVVVSGSKTNLLFEKYNKMLKHVNTKISQEHVRLIQAQFRNDEDEITSQDKKIAKLMRAKYLRAIQFTKQNKRSVVTAYIGARELPEVQTSYLDVIYNGLSKNAKKSIYGNELKTIIEARNKQ